MGLASQVTNDTEKADMLNAFFTFILTDERLKFICAKLEDDTRLGGEKEKLPQRDLDRLKGWASKVLEKINVKFCTWQNFKALHEHLVGIFQPNSLPAIWKLLNRSEESCPTASDLVKKNGRTSPKVQSKHARCLGNTHELKADLETIKPSRALIPTRCSSELSKMEKNKPTSAGKEKKKTKQPQNAQQPLIIDIILPYLH
ncbi:hypothetical protein GRJ2_000830900 [Grus japonensis]|uniref:Uncharacterized protein n=1 Tax=Grus japonensis TaxID=30415 RepID=A0ABC9WDS1_GRUJA